MEQPQGFLNKNNHSGQKKVIFFQNFFPDTDSVQSNNLMSLSADNIGKLKTRYTPSNHPVDDWYSSSLLGITSKAHCRDPDEALNMNASHLSSRPSAGLPSTSKQTSSSLFSSVNVSSGQSTAIWRTVSHPKSPKDTFVIAQTRPPASLTSKRAMAASSLLSSKVGQEAPEQR